MFTFLLLVFCLFVLFSLADLIDLEARAKLPLLFVSFLILALTAGLRYGDRDYLNYEKAYELSPLWFTGHGVIAYFPMEKGYLFLNALLKNLGFSYTAFLLFVSFTTVSLALCFFRRYTPYILLAILIYFSHVFFLRDMLQIRSAISIGIAMFSLPYIEKRKFFKTAGILVFAVLFHFVGGVLFIVYFAYPYLQSSRTQIILIMSGLLLGSVVGVAFFVIMQKTVNSPLLLNYLVDSTFNKPLGLLNPVLLKHLIVIPILMYNRRFLEARIPYFKVMLVSYVIAAFWLSAFNVFSIFAARIATAFSNVEHILIPSLMLLRKYRILTFIGIVGYCFVAFWTKKDGLELMQFIFNR